jgi:hypothetical protein
MPPIKNCWPVGVGFDHTTPTLMAVVPAGTVKVDETHFSFAMPDGRAGPDLIVVPVVLDTHSSTVEAPVLYPFTHRV